MSESAKARCTDGWRRQMSERMKVNNLVGENNLNYGNALNIVNPMLGKKHTEESKRKMSVNRKGKLTGAENPRARAIVQLTKDGEFIRQWDYVTLAADFLGVKPWNIITCCSHSDKLKTAYGFKWMYLEDYKDLTKQND